HSHATELGVSAQAAPAPFNVGLISFLEALGSGHHAIVPSTAFFVTAAVQGCQQGTRQLGSLFQNGLGRVRINSVTGTSHGSPEFVSFKNLRQNKAHVTQGSLILSHLVFLRFFHNDRKPGGHPVEKLIYFTPISA